MRRRDFVTGAAALAACGQLSRPYAQPSGQTAAPAQVAVSPDNDRLPVGFYNFTGSNLPNWASALAAQRRGLSNAIIGCLGDSTVAGQGATSDELASMRIMQRLPSSILPRAA